MVKKKNVHNRRQKALEANKKWLPGYITDLEATRKSDYETPEEYTKALEFATKRVSKCRYDIKVLEERLVYNV